MKTEFNNWLNEVDMHLTAVLDGEELLADAGLDGMVAEKAIEHIKAASKIIATLKEETSSLKE